MEYLPTIHFTASLKAYVVFDAKMTLKKNSPEIGVLPHVLY